MNFSFGLAILIFGVIAAAFYDEAKTFIMKKIYYSKKNRCLQAQWDKNHRHDAWSIRKGNCECHDRKNRRIKGKGKGKW